MTVIMKMMMMTTNIMLLLLLMMMMIIIIMMMATTTTTVVMISRRRKEMKMKMMMINGGARTCKSERYSSAKLAALLTCSISSQTDTDPSTVDMQTDSMHVLHSICHKFTKTRNKLMFRISSTSFSTDDHKAR